MTQATVKEWFERKLVNDGIILAKGCVYTFSIFAIIKETEKAVYAMCYVGSMGDKACKKTIWIPKSVIENIEAAQRISDYETASEAFEIAY